MRLAEQVTGAETADWDSVASHADSFSQFSIHHSALHHCAMGLFDKLKQGLKKTTPAAEHRHPRPVQDRGPAGRRGSSSTSCSRR